MGGGFLGGGWGGVGGFLGGGGKKGQEGEEGGDPAPIFYSPPLFISLSHLFIFHAPSHPPPSFCVHHLPTPPLFFLHTYINLRNIFFL